MEHCSKCGLFWVEGVFEMARQDYIGGGSAVEYAGEGTMRLTQRSIPEPGPGQVRIRVSYCGICGTDLHILHGNMDHRVSVPQVIGHEASGTVDAVGDGVDFQIGDKVTVMPLEWCGKCPACSAGHRHICHNLKFIGIETTGAMQQFWVVPDSVIVPVPAELSLKHAALIEPLAVAAHDVRRSRLVRGEIIVVLGGGPIGQLISLVALELGARVVLVEPDPERRAFAGRHGAQVIDPAGQDLEEAIENRTGGAGADVVFEVAGVAATALQATRLVRTRGRVVFVAIHPTPVPVDLHRVFWREVEVLGARVYEREDFDRAIELLVSSRIPADEIITRTVPLRETQLAFQSLNNAQALKVLIDVQN